MSDMKESFDYMEELNKERKERDLASASREGWHLHTEYHWSRQLRGKRLDYWPSKNKFQYDGKVMHGDVLEFIGKDASATHGLSSTEGASLSDLLYWRPIDTAPKDGTYIYVCREGFSGTWVATYQPVYQSGFVPKNPWSSRMLNHGHLKDKTALSKCPTHWMPLPKAI